jgi:hypothetical protein
MPCPETSNCQKEMEEDKKKKKSRTLKPMEVHNSMT